MAESGTRCGRLRYASVSLPSRESAWARARSPIANIANPFRPKYDCLVAGSALNVETFEPQDTGASARVFDFIQEAVAPGRSTAPATAKLVDADGSSVELPAEVFRALSLIAQCMAAGKGITVAPVEQRLTTQEAADFLGFSRPTLIKFLERGDIPFTLVGRHRRVRLGDLIAYQKQAGQTRRAALQEMADIARESGLYEAATGSPVGVR